MPHVSKKDLLRASDAGRSEVARLAAHLAGCAACRSRALSLLRDRALPAKCQVPLRTLLELAAFEEREAVERLRVRAEFAALRRLTRAAQKERLILSRLCHSLAFVDVLLAAVRAPHPREEAEFLSGLAVLAVQGMKHISEAFRNDLLSSIWTETAIGLQTLAEIEEQGTVLHDQLRRVLRGFIDAARGQTLDQNVLREVDEYLRAHWKYPAAVDPVIPTGEKVPVSPAPAAALVDKALVVPLLMRALWSRIRRGTRRVQQAQVGASPECHTKEFLDLLLGELAATESRDEAEFIAHLALRAVEESAEPAEAREDFRAQVWTEIANVRRIAAEWNHAETALHRAHEHLGRGAGSPLLKARAQSVAASLLFDQGRRAQAVAALEECLKLYEDAKAWPLVARTLVQTAHALVENAPECALSVAEKALPFIPAEDSVLRWLTESIRTESLIEMGETGQALQAFHLAESLRGGHARPDADLRSNYTAARLLEALGRFDEAEQLFEAVIAEAFDREAYRAAFLDTLYLFGLHIRRDARDKAVALCRAAIARLDVPDVGHEQLRAVWTELMDAAMLRAIRLEGLAEVREFLKVYWKYPASKPPRFSF